MNKVARFLLISLLLLCALEAVYAKETAESRLSKLIKKPIQISIAEIKIKDNPTVVRYDCFLAEQQDYTKTMAVDASLNGTITVGELKYSNSPIKNEFSLQQFTFVKERDKYKIKTSIAGKELASVKSGKVYKLMVVNSSNEDNHYFTITDGYGISGVTKYYFDDTFSIFDYNGNSLDHNYNGFEFSVPAADTIEVFFFKNATEFESVLVESDAYLKDQGKVISSGIKIDNKELKYTSEVVVVSKGTTANIAFQDDSSWNEYSEKKDGVHSTGVFSKGAKYEISSFAIGQYEVTRELYQAVISKFEKCDATPWITQSKTSKGKGNQVVVKGEIDKYRPASFVSIWDALYFCNALTTLTMGEEHCVYTIRDILRLSNYDDREDFLKKGVGSIVDATVYTDPNKKGYRLPSSIEREFAARGGNPKAKEWRYAYPGVQSSKMVVDGDISFVDPVLCDYAWFSETTNNNYDVHQVGLKKPNSLGLYDLAGNVVEYCPNNYPEFGYFSLNPTEDAFYVGSMVFYSGYGGSYDSLASKCTVSIRCLLGSGLVSENANKNGFRIVRNLD